MPTSDEFREPPPLERTGPFKTLYYWKQLDFEYPSEEDKDAAIRYNDFIPKHNLPLGMFKVLNLFSVNRERFSVSHDLICRKQIQNKFQL